MNDLMNNSVRTTFETSTTGLFCGTGCPSLSFSKCTFPEDPRDGGAPAAATAAAAADSDCSCCCCCCCCGCCWRESLLRAPKFGDGEGAAVGTEEAAVEGARAVVGEQVTRSQNIVVDGWAGASNLHSLPNPTFHPPYTRTYTNNYCTSK